MRGRIAHPRISRSQYAGEDTYARRHRHVKRPAGRSCPVHGRPAFGTGGRGLGKDARAHLPHCPSRGGLGCGAVGNSCDHLHQQGRCRNARAPSRHHRAAVPRHVGLHLSQHVRAHVARRRRASRLLEELHYLRHRRSEAPVQGNHGRARHRPEALSRKRPHGAHLPGEKRAHRAGRFREAGD